MRLTMLLLLWLANIGWAQKAFKVSQDMGFGGIIPPSLVDFYDSASAEFQDQFHIEYTDGTIRGKHIHVYPPPPLEDDLNHLKKRIVSDENAATINEGQLYLDLMIGWSKGNGIGGDGKRYKMPVNLWNNVTILYDYDKIPLCSDKAMFNPCKGKSNPRCIYMNSVSCNYRDNIFAYNTTNGTNIDEVLLGSPNKDYQISFLKQTLKGGLYTDYVQMGDPDEGNAGLPVRGFGFVAAQSGSTMFAGMGFAPGNYLVGNMSNQEISTDFSAALMFNGYTESRSLALFLVNGSSSSPHMLFGGLDTSLAKDNFFVSYPLLTGNNFSYPTQYMITLTGVSVTAADGTSASLGTLAGSCGDDPKGDCVAVGFDTTTYMSYLPREVVVNMAIQLNAMYSADMQLWIQSCAYRNVGGYLNIELTSKVFSVPISQMLKPMVDSQGNIMKFNGGEDACFLALRPSENRGYNSLGLGFLQSFYTVFDPDNNYVSLGILKSMDELNELANQPKWPSPVKPLKPGRLSRIANVTTVSEQAQITYQYVPPTQITDVITATPEIVGMSVPPLAGPAPSSANSLMLLTFGSSVMSLQGIPFGTSAFMGTATPSSGNAKIDPTGVATILTTSTQKPPQIQIFGTPISGSQTIFKQGSATVAPRTTQNAPLGDSPIGAPRSGSSSLLNELRIILSVSFLSVGLSIVV